MQCDGKALDLTDKSLEGIVILNIPSMYGGTNIWGNTSEKKKSKKKDSQKNLLRFKPQGWISAANFKAVYVKNI